MKDGGPLKKIVGYNSPYPFTESMKSHRHVWLECGHSVVTRRKYDAPCHRCAEKAGRRSRKRGK